MVKQTAIERLRKVVNYFSHMHEDFNHRFTEAELMKIATFSLSEQGGRVHECADSWPPFLLKAVLKAKLGAKLDETLVKRAGDLC